MIFIVYTYREAKLFARCAARLAPSQVICHVDQKVPIEPFIEEVRRSGTRNVTFVDERHTVNWGGWSQVEAIRTLVAAALDIADDDDYVILLSGQDYPLRPATTLASHLEAHAGTQFMRCFLISEADDGYRRQATPAFHRDLPILARRRRMHKIRNGVIRAIEWADLRLRDHELPPEGLDPAFGPTHFALQAGCLRHLESVVTPEIEAFYRRVFCPEEQFYQTLIMNSPYRDALPNPGGEPFRGRGNWRYSNLHHIDPSLTRVFTIEDWCEVRESQKFFLRKLEFEQSKSLIEKIDIELLHG